MSEDRPLVEAETTGMRTRSRRCVARLLWFIDMVSAWVLRPEILVVFVVLIILFIILWHNLLGIYVEESMRYASDDGLSPVKHGPGRHLDGYKYILVWAGCFGRKDCGWGGTSYFFRNLGCPEDRCMVISDHEQIQKAEVVVFHIRDMKLGMFTIDTPSYRNPNQLWVFFSHESPYNTYVGSGLLSSWNRDVTYLDGIFNATMSYMTQSDFFLPYYTYRPRVDPRPLYESFSYRNKTKLLLWVVSNCHSDSRRTQYANELKKHVQLDVYGTCGEPHPCGATHQDDACFDRFIRQYKFYLAFENGECRDYITEKFWGTLERGVVPVVMGANHEDYTKMAPPDSFIHVDNFTSPRELAAYVQYLDKNDAAYYKYLKWKEKFELIDGSRDPQHRGLCKMCAAAHNKTIVPRRSYNVSDWFSIKRLCRMS